MQLERLFTEALGIKAPWKIVSLQFDSDKKRLDIKVDFERGSAFEYEDSSTKKKGSYGAYDTVEKTWRHLSFFEHECYIHARIPSVKPTSGGIKLISPPWSGLGHGFTLLFEALILQLCKNMPVNQAGKILGISDHRLWHVLECYVYECLTRADHSNVDTVGMDETSLKRGHNYITLFVDMIEKKTIFITEGKDHNTVCEFVKSLENSKGNGESIRNISCDMSPAFIKGVKEKLPNAQITFDKFHVLKVINTAVDEVRRSEAQENPILKGSRYIFLKNESNLSKKQKKQRASLSQLNLKSMKALHVRENFQEIYQAVTYQEFENYLNKWYFWATHC